MTARSKSSSVFRHRPQEARAETESSKPRKIVQGRVERTFGWLGRCRRLAKDFEALTRTHLAFVQLAMIRLMMRRLGMHAAKTASGARTKLVMLADGARHGQDRRSGAGAPLSDPSRPLAGLEGF